MSEWVSEYLQPYCLFSRNVYPDSLLSALLCLIISSTTVVWIVSFVAQKVSCHWKCWQVWCQLWCHQLLGLATKWNRTPKMVSQGPRNYPLRFQCQYLVCTEAATSPHTVLLRSLSYCVNLKCLCNRCFRIIIT